MVLERSVPLLQQEEEELRTGEGIHREHNGNTETKNGGYTQRLLFGSGLLS